ncbi:DUF1638 domain-containing protein [Candidatus Magnetaquicoccus inordinatus]|uniref:DUF1638 domain-containing protein n=1 Tax=Candidatus Magnetaquicoccus inordinatus TaxID=2496818 RepID=UPI00102B6B8C|nr:DUF1638 domain-containing protein [Candidatus Magnetaquicoccus inordinatus]
MKALPEIVAPASAEKSCTHAVPMISCGILAREINFLIAKNGWPVKPHYLDSTLHNHLAQLSGRLQRKLVEQELAGDRCLVVYGSCHPRMEGMLADYQAIRTASQNCISMLLGQDLFMSELEQGSYFLLEEWAARWREIFLQIFGPKQEVVQEIFQSCHRRLVAVYTPCSDDFLPAAQAAADYVGLPLLRLDVSLEHLEQLLAETLINWAQDGSR